MRKIIAVLLCSVFLASSAAALSPATTDFPDAPEVETAPAVENGGYSDADLNMIANVVNGEVGGICGTVVLTYADGSQLWTDGSTLRMIHARIVDNQVQSAMFPATVSGCVGTYWSTSYTGTGWRDSAQWQSCRQAVVDALAGGVSVPSNVYAATCDSYFATYYPGWYLWARVDWDTGWYSGTFYYYAYG